MTKVKVNQFDQKADQCIQVCIGDQVICHICDKLASKQCDFINSQGLRCNATLCLDCKISVSNNIDQCPNH